MNTNNDKSAMVGTKRVIIESPYAGDVEANVAYARECMLDSLRRGEAPIASHLLYPQVLDDLVPAERAQGIAAGLAWRDVAEAQVFYIDRGWSNGMQAAWDAIPDRLTAIAQGRVECRRLHDA